MSSERGKLYQDPIYGAKVLSPLAVAIIDTPEFQRLAGLRQLGFAELVYRGARHTRFEHSVGTYFICRTIMRRIVQNHERLGLEHPGQHLSERFRYFPPNAGVERGLTTHQSCWRGLTEAVSAAALLHDLGHVPFGHTLEDEFAGLYRRHDRLAGHRLYEMLFNESSHLKRNVFSAAAEHWVEGVSNEDLARLIYVILNWKEDVDPPVPFVGLLDRALAKPDLPDAQRERLELLKEWHDRFLEAKLFHPFMSDIIGNTICADLLDYLPRDRQNLGMEPRFHTRLQRYFTIRKDALQHDGALRLSIMVTRKGRGGQRRDVATAVLAIMRERYEMAERVFYHHKKAAASALLARLLELAPAELRPRDDEAVYPAPWTDHSQAEIGVPHVIHLSDSSLIDYLGSVRVPPEQRDLQKRLYLALRFRRRDIYCTLLPIDVDLVRAGKRSIAYVAEELRGPKEQPSGEGRRRLERQFAEAAGGADGDVIVYCPSPDMQSKEVDARLEIREGGVLPLRLQVESFTYHPDVDILHQYYSELWRAYVFVAPAVFSDATKCKAIIDSVCEAFGMPVALAYPKVRTHDFALAPGLTMRRTLELIQGFIINLPFDLPREQNARLLSQAATDAEFAAIVNSGAQPGQRLSALLELTVLAAALEAAPPPFRRLTKHQRERIEARCDELLKGAQPSLIAARFDREKGRWPDFNAYRNELLEHVTGQPIPEAV